MLLLAGCTDYIYIYIYIHTYIYTHANEDIYYSFALTYIHACMRTSRLAVLLAHV
jgi:hypothetical protein